MSDDEDEMEGMINKPLSNPFYAFTLTKMISETIHGTLIALHNF